MSTHNIQFHDKIRISLNICFLELSEELKNEFELGVQGIEVRLYIVFGLSF